MSANDETHAETVDEQIKYRAESLRWEEEDKKRAQIESARLLSELTEPFPPEVERILRKAGTALTYIPVSEVITRMNRVFGVKGWSSEIVKCERDALDPDFIVAHVRLTLATRWGETVQKDGFGGQKIKRTKSGDIVDLGDEFKGAVSDALKKAAQQFGIALYLARSDEALSLEVEQDNIAAAPKVIPKVLPKLLRLFSNDVTSFLPLASPLPLYSDKIEKIKLAIYCLSNLGAFIKSSCSFI